MCRRYVSMESLAISRAGRSIGQRGPERGFAEGHHGSPSFVTIWNGKGCSAVPKRTYQPKRIKRIRKFGFLARMADRGGRAVLARRRRKGRHALTVAEENKFTQNR